MAYATEKQQAILNRFASKAPADLAELKEYATVCAAINKDGNGDMYGIIVMLCDRMTANFTLLAKETGNAKE